MTPSRLRASGKWLFLDDEKFLVKGVTYGTFKPDENDVQFPEASVVRADLEAITAHGFNTVRTYTPPPEWMLDHAGELGLRVLIGLPWEQHTTFLDRRKATREIRRSVRDAARSTAGHPAVLGFAVGNEIPSTIVRWHGSAKIEAFVHSLYKEVKSADSDALVTYVNYPTTEYLHLPFLDFHSFNVFLEERQKLDDYLARLHNVIGDRPLLLTEVGLDSQRKGLDGQAESLQWQIEAILTSGCAGACVFAWTDEWWRGGFDVEDWDFGLVRRDREPKPALASSKRALDQAPVPDNTRLPLISVVVATRNGATTIEDTLVGLSKLDYPSYEVIVVDDGSTDNTRLIALDHGVKVIPCEGQGLSDGRNTGLKYARGEIIAYIDDDAYPDRDWLTYLAWAYDSTDFVAVGGPNIVPEDSGPIAHCVANSPGGPVHVLLDDRVAEHIPGCNMSFRKDALEAIGGFDSRFTAAGDDVDVCWRIQEAGWQVGFHPGALVWHHRRNSFRAYWKQQKGYGKAEAILERKWPERYNRAGHVAWGGRIYGRGVTESAFESEYVYQGVWGQAPFQSIYVRNSSHINSLPLMPEWLLLVALLGGLSLLGLVWTPLLIAFPFLVAAVMIQVLQAYRSSSKARFPSSLGGRYKRVMLRFVVVWMHLIQPLGRLTGRIKHGLTIWRRRGSARLGSLRQASWSLWSTQWSSPTDWRERIEGHLKNLGAPAQRGSAFAGWDFEVRGGVLASSRLLVAIEEHGSGNQLVRAKYWSRYARIVGIASGVLLVALLWAAFHGQTVGMVVAAAALAALLGASLYDAMRAAGVVESSLEGVQRDHESKTAIDASEPDSRIVVVNGSPTPSGNGVTVRAAPYSSPAGGQSGDDSVPMPRR